jgi:diguanylate cyclase (GGDEF)-like protein
LFYLDLDDFKKVNDTWGHHVGDQLLKAVGHRITSILRKSDVLFRIGGDEFVVLVDKIINSDDSVMMANRILHVFKTEFILDRYSVNISCSIGVSVYPGNGSTAPQLLQNADTAMYKTKDAGRNAFMFYSLEMSRSASVQLAMEQDISNALSKGEFKLYYQPRINLDLGMICGAEALIRWQHPNKGLIPTGAFIKIAEKSDLIIDIGFWMREQVVQQLMAWEGGEFEAIKISVNVSGKEFMKDKVIPHLKTLFSETELKQQLLELEITEDSLMTDGLADVEKIDLLQGLECGLSVDDFGTGYSSLGYLKNYAVDTLKIDKSFIDRVTYSERNASIVRAVIVMAHSLNMAVVAEGVENAVQWGFLQDHRCDQIQGYFYCPPLPVDEFEAFVQFVDHSSFDEEGMSDYSGKT